MFDMSAIATAAFRCVVEKRDSGGNPFCPEYEAVGSVIFNMRNPVGYSTDASGEQNALTLVSIWYSTFWTLLDLLDPSNDTVPNFWHINEFCDKTFTSRVSQLNTENQRNIDACLLRLGVIEATLQKFRLVDWSGKNISLRFWDPETPYPLGGFLHRFKPYHNLISDMQSRVPFNSRRAIQLELASDLRPTNVTPDMAIEILSSWFRKGPLFLLAQTAWKLLLQSLEKCGLEYIRHDKEYAILNKRLRQIEERSDYLSHPNPERDQVLTLMSIESTKHREAIGLPVWLLKERLNPRETLQK